MDAEASIFHRVLHSESASRNGKLETLFQQTTFDADKPRAMVTRNTEAAAFNFQRGSYVRECFTNLGCAGFVVTRLHYSTMVHSLFSSQDDGKLRILIELNLLSSDETTMEVGQRIFLELMAASDGCAHLVSPPRNKLQTRIETVQIKLLQ